MNSLGMNIVYELHIHVLGYNNGFEIYKTNRVSYPVWVIGSELCGYYSNPFIEYYSRHIHIGFFGFNSYIFQYR